MKTTRKIIIIGGGASGMAAGVMAARAGADVVILEQKERLGKKILSTGNGKCNFTNTNMKASYFRGEDTTIVSKVLEQFGAEDTVRFFQELGIVPKNRQGYLYPKSEQAAAVADVLIMELKRLHVEVRLSTKVLGIEKRRDFLVKTSEGNLRGDAVILATGGKASPALGSDGSGYAFAKSFGHSISPVVPALVQLHGKGTFFKNVAGVRVNAEVSIYVDGRRLASDTGELQLTNYGISGIPVFQVSRYAALALQEKAVPTAVLDFMPEYSVEGLCSFFGNRKESNPVKTAEEFLVGMFNKKLIPILLRASGIRGNIPVKDLEEPQLKRLASKCKTFEVEITAVNPFEQAQVCAGGVRTSEIHDTTMESRIVENLYITGELLDIDGICGGYNLQWAWSTGVLAGKSAAKGKDE